MQGFIETHAGNAQRDYEDLVSRALKILRKVDLDFWLTDIIVHVEDSDLSGAIEELQHLDREASTTYLAVQIPLSAVAGLLNRALQAKERMHGSSDNRGPYNSERGVSGSTEA